MEDDGFDKGFAEKSGAEKGPEGHADVAGKQTGHIKQGVRELEEGFRRARGEVKRVEK